jgi:Zn-dependent protease
VRGFFYHDWHYHIGKFAGIPIVIHVSFLAMLVVRAVWPFLTGKGLNGSVNDIALVLMAFGFVFLHELGHAFAARKYGIRTKDIVFFPIGCAAELHIPDDPKQELRIAIAGPAVNFVFAALLYPLYYYMNPETLMGKVVLYAFAVNLLIMVFNLLPAFPMDGGRILRALIALKFDRVKATWFAAAVAELFGVLFIVAGFKLGAGFFLIALFVMVFAPAEAYVTQNKAQGHYDEIKEMSFSDHPVAITG